MEKKVMDYAIEASKNENVKELVNQFNLLEPGTAQEVENEINKIIYTEELTLNID